MRRRRRLPPPPPRLAAALPLLLVLLLGGAARPARAALFAPAPSLSDAVYTWLHGRASPSSSVAAAHPRAPPPPSAAPPARLPAWVSGAPPRANASAGARPAYARQMMHRAELDLIAAYLRPRDVYLEFGAGGSTLNFAPLVGSAYSLEHDCEWADYVRAAVRGKADYGRLQVRCVNVPPGYRAWGTLSPTEHGNYAQFKEYVDAVATFPDTMFDKVLIDGRARVACALKVLRHLHPDSVVFLHDFYARLHLYAAVLPYYVEVARVLAHRNTDPEAGPVDEPQGLLVLRPRRAVAPPTDRDIHAAYAAINWRLPFADPLTSPPAYARYYARLATDLSLWRRARNPHALVRLVRHDLLRLALLYAVVMFVLRNWRALSARAAPRAGAAPTLAPQGPAAPAVKSHHPAKTAPRRPDAATVLVRGGGGAEPSRRNVGADSASSAAAVGKSQSSGRGVDADRVSAVGKTKALSEPRFVETEAMKAASARRKARQQAGGFGKGS